MILKVSASKSIMALRTLVLDFDGVIFRNKHATTLVNNKSIKFVAKTMNCSYQYALQFHKCNFDNHGHTVHMLNSMGYDTTLSDYNSYVFNAELWYDLEFIMTSQDEHNIKLISQTNDKLNKKSVLFSNAPESWCKTILSINGFSLDDLFEETFTCKDITTLKPNKSNYEKIESKYGNLYFIDDSEVNLTGLSKKWNTYLLNSEEKLDEKLELVITDILKT